MNENGVGTVLCDTNGRRDALHMNPTIPEAFVRFVSNGNNNLDIDKVRIDEWVDRIEAWTKWGLEKIYFMIHTLDYEPPYLYEYAAGELIIDLDLICLQ
jgi:hypothetical protein